MYSTVSPRCARNGVPRYTVILYTLTLLVSPKKFRKGTLIDAGIVRSPGSRFCSARSTSWGIFPMYHLRSDAMFDARMIPRRSSLFGAWHDTCRSNRRFDEELGRLSLSLSEAKSRDDACNNVTATENMRGRESPAEATVTCLSVGSA
jgi:hypothetical protein